jgi:hypothetical protein
MADWRSTAVELPGITEYINQQIALGRIGGTLGSSLPGPADARDWRTAATQFDGLCEYINQQIALGKISTIPTSVTAAVPADPRNWRAAGITTGDPLCDFINQEISLGRITIGGGISPPGAPVLFFDAQNTDGTNNSSLVDGQQIATWKNLGSLGAAGNIAQGTAGVRPFYRLVAAAGKINNKSAIESTGTHWMVGSAFTGLTQPTMVAIVWKSSSLAATATLFDGALGGNVSVLNTTGALQGFSGAGYLPGQSIVVNTWNVNIMTFNPSPNSQNRLNGANGASSNAGGTLVTNAALFALTGGTTILNGMIEEVIIYTDATTPAQVEAYVATKLGAMPQ